MLSIWHYVWDCHTFCLHLDDTNLVLSSGLILNCFLYNIFLRQHQCCIQMYFGIVWTVWVPKKVLPTLFPCIFLIKTKWNIVYEYLKTKTFARDTNIFPQMHWISNIFGHSAAATGGFWVSLNYPILNFKKTVCPKNLLTWLWTPVKYCLWSW